MLRSFCNFLVLLLFGSVSLFGQGATTGAAAPPGVSQTEITILDEAVTLYPSLIPVYQIKVAGTPPFFTTLPRDPGDYQLTVNGKVSKIVSAVRPTRTAGKDDWAVVYLILIKPNIKKDDKLVVTVTDPKSKRTAKSNELKAAGSSNVSFGLAPSFVQSEALDNGAKRPVGQLDVTLDEQNIPLSQSFRTHFTTDSIVSSDGKDKKSDVNMLFGAEWNLSRSWYLPFHLDTKVIGDQVLNNAYSVSSAGVSTLIPWGWTRSFLNNPVLDAPVSPLFTFDTQFQRAFREDLAALKISRSKDLFRLHAQGAWTPIRLLKGDGSGDFVSLQIGGQGWYIPADRTYTNVLKDRLEGVFQATVLVPVGKLSTSNGPGLTTAKKGTQSIIQIQYSRGANEATGFAHSTQLSIGLQVSSTK